jgi:quinolinate synthase
MSTKYSNLAAHYYQMAKEICDIADAMGDGRREMMHRVAQNYERIAKSAEAAEQNPPEAIDD